MVGAQLGNMSLVCFGLTESISNMATVKLSVHLLEDLGQPEVCCLGELCEGQLYVLGAGRLCKMTSVFWTSILMSSKCSGSHVQPGECSLHTPLPQDPTWD